MARQPDQVRIRRGNHGDVIEPVGKWALRLQPYAAMAAIVYRNADSRQVPDPPGWRRSPDPQNTVDRSNGLYLEVWEHALETAVVFRGTQFFQWQDWWSNLRWFRPFRSGKLDQYYFVATHIQGIVERARPGIPVVAVGHSLGGGLAQHAAYAHPNIKHVFAFDPSPVTGFRSVPKPDRDRNRVGIEILRPYERGEILAFIRGFMQRLLPLSTKDPEITEVRFDFRGTGAITQHSMVQLALDLQHAVTTGSIALPPPTPVVKS